jgi:penicillin-binding protein 1A
VEPTTESRKQVQKIAEQLAGYFKAVVNPDLPWTVRLKCLMKAGLASGTIVFALLLIYAIVLIPFTPTIADLRKAKAETPSILMSSDGKELAVFKRLNREWVKLDEISPYIVKALIATEDHRFYEHHGVDLKRTAAGILRTIQGDPEGGSTLTQQLARNLYPEEIGRKRTITRKLKELITALKIEYAYSKDEILLTYLNTMPFLYNAFGIEMGARTYFDKPAAKLDVLESATLVGMLKGTSYYNPVLNRERALKRRNVVMSQMVKRGVLSSAEFDRLKRRPIRLDFERQPEPFGVTPHFAANVRKWLIEWADRNDYNLYSDGLVVYSTIDSRMQAFAEQAIARQTQLLQSVSDGEKGVSPMRNLFSGVNAHRDLQRRMPPQGRFWRARDDLLNAFVRESAPYRAAVDAGTPPEIAMKQIRENPEFIARLTADKTRLESGFVAIDPTNGHVKVWVGSRDFAVDQFDHVAQARRQPGSTFKPFVYGAALEQGMSPDTRFTDMAVEVPLGNGSVWRPTDAVGPSGQPMALRDALAYSRNAITAQVMQKVGPEKVASFAQRLGVNQSSLDPVPALSLGTSPVTLLEMVSAYSTIANGGEYRTPVMVSHIADRTGKVLETFTSDTTRAISDKIAYDLIDMMRGVVKQGTGRPITTRFGLRADLAGKTGTTQDNTDGWFILMHPRLVTGAWVGFNDARITMGNSQWGQGARTALPMVGEFYRRTLHARFIESETRFAPPPDSFFSSLLDKLYGFFGVKKTTPATPSPRTPPVQVRHIPPSPPPAAAPDIRSDEMERIANQAREAESAFGASSTDKENMPQDREQIIDDGNSGTVLISNDAKEGAAAN